MFDPRTPTAVTFKTIARRLTPVRAVAAGAALVVGFLVAALLFDEPVGAALRAWPDHERAFFLWLTGFGKSDWILLPSLVLFVLGQGLSVLPIGWSWRWALRGLSLMAGYIFLSVGAAGLVTVIIKRIVGRARPYVDDTTAVSFLPFDLFDYTHHSFPSGHSTTAIALAVALYTLTNGRFRGVLLLIGALIGLSRIVVGDHYLTDVVAGLLVGTVVAFLVRDVFATRRWGMTIANQRVVSRLHVMFQPALRRIASQIRAR